MSGRLSIDSDAAPRPASYVDAIVSSQAGRIADGLAIDSKFACLFEEAGKEKITRESIAASLFNAGQGYGSELADPYFRVAKLIKRVEQEQEPELKKAIVQEEVDKLTELVRNARSNGRTEENAVLNTHQKTRRLIGALFPELSI